MGGSNDGRKEEKKEKDRKHAVPAFAYAETIRGHQRMSLDAETCVCCEKYYEATGQERLKAISRHRSPFKRPPSPPGFWDIGPF